MNTTGNPIIDANALEAMAKERPNEKFLKGSGVLKLIQAIRDLERANRQLQAEQPIQIKNLRKALQFYADGHHFIKSDGDAWDTVSGEPQNYWCDEAGTATVEDGSIAKLALAGHPIKFEDEDGTHAPRTKSEASREFLERMLSAMEGVIDVADRQTDEFEALRSCVVDLTLMLFKPEALRASNGQAPAGAADARSDALCDSSYVAGAKTGFNLGVGHDYDALSRLVEGRHGYLQVLAATRPLPTPTAQAAPAAERENLELRRMLCIAHAGAAAYMDDGEAQDNRELPLIDFLHDTPAEIQDKLQRRALKKLAAQAAAPTPAAQADSVLEDAARWNEVLMHVGAANHLGGQHFTLNTLRIRDQMFLLRGSVAQHFTACIDDSRAASKQGGA